MQITHYLNNKTGIVERATDSVHSENTAPPDITGYSPISTHDANISCDYCVKPVSQPGQVVEYEGSVPGWPDPAKPSYYNKGDIEPVDYMQAKMTGEQYQGFCLGNVIKYVSRYQDKNGLQDLQKAQWYLNEMIRAYKEQTPSS